MILFDTDILSLFLRGHSKVVRRTRAPEEDVAITVVTKIEIPQGRYHFLLTAQDGEVLLRAQYWLARSEKDLDSWVVLPVTLAAAAEFDRLSRMKSLRKIGRADLLIASIALSESATLISRNRRHFQQVPHLRLENWAD